MFLDALGDEYPFFWPLPDSLSGELDILYPLLETVVLCLDVGEPIVLPFESGLLYESSLVGDNPVLDGLWLDPIIVVLLVSFGSV